MKVVKLKYISEEGKSFRVYLGNGTIHHFSRKRNAQDFLSTTNKFLTSRLYESRDIFTAIWNKYQQNWAYFDNDKATRKSELRENDRECRMLLDNIEEQFNLIAQRSWFQNGNYHVFSQFNYIIENLKVIVKHLNNISKKQSVAMELFGYDNLFERLQTLATKINNYGQLEAHSLFKMPQHIDMDKEFIPQLPQLKVA